MTRTPDELANTERFAARYRVSGAEIIQEIERATCGCDYGATSWTTRDEADRVGRLLGLGPGRQLLDIGSGSGWPALYFARQTGCDVALTDLPLEGLRHAAQRAAEDRPAGKCVFAVADAASLPFGDDRFDAISHSDVLCCLKHETAALEECRRVLAPGGIMVFTVISIVPGLSPTDREKAAASGPPFVAADAPYPDLLLEAGWKIVERTDVTKRFAETLHAVYHKETRHAQSLRDVIGDEALADKMGRRQRAIAGVDNGLLQREMFVVEPH
jgi:ubiquinone/menaquinone biosynthesis C-methylase UbiE